MWHSHNEREITTNNIFPGGMLMMMLVDSREFVIDESNVRTRDEEKSDEKPMQTNHLRATLKAAVSVVGLLLFGAVAAFGQQQVNLTAGPATVTLPDGSAVPMWGYSCGAAVTGSTATCATLNPAADRLVSRGDYGSHGTGPDHQPHEQSLVCERQ